MSDDPIKQRYRRAKHCAAESLKNSGYGIIEPGGNPFDIIAVRYSEARFIRIVFGRISANDIKACRALIVPPNCYREVWLRGGKNGDFKIEAVV
jgi:hypothetical protein